MSRVSSGDERTSFKNLITICSYASKYNPAFHLAQCCYVCRSSHKIVQSDIVLIQYVLFYYL